MIDPKKEPKKEPSMSPIFPPTFQSDLIIRLNREQADLLLTALNGLPEELKKKITYEKLRKDVETIKALWEDKIKKDEMLKKLKTAKRQAV